MTQASKKLETILVVDDTPALLTGVVAALNHANFTVLLLKKPWSLSKTVEFMFGAGPEWVRTRQNGPTTNSVAGEPVLDLMFWPSAKRVRLVS